MSGGVQPDGPRDWNAPVDVALLAAAAPHPSRAARARALDPAALADADAVARAGSSSSTAGCRRSCPSRGKRADAARRRAPRATRSDGLPALEDWGFDAEAAEAWMHSGVRARRAARRRAAVPDVWAAVRTIDAAADPARFLVVMRQVLAREHDHAVDLLPEFPSEWLGQHLAVHDLPLRDGSVSFALRWHGARPALLWDGPAGTALRCRSTRMVGGGGAGEALLAARRRRCSPWGPPAARARASTSPNRSHERQSGAR